MMSKYTYLEINSQVKYPSDFMIKFMKKEVKENLKDNPNDIIYCKCGEFYNVLSYKNHLSSKQHKDWIDLPVPIIVFIP